MHSRKLPIPAPRGLAAIGVVLFLAYGLRAYAVGHSALRGDEGFAVTFVAQSLDKLMTAMARTEPNPPLYWLILKGWMGLAGGSELAVRWPSVLAGVATVALTYQLGRALMDAKVALMAALCVAFSPLLIWYAQDARVYALLAALVLAAAWQTWEAARRNAWRNWLAAGALWWLALFAHYFALLSFVSVGVALWFAPQTRARRWPGLAMFLGVGLAQLPWAFYVAPLLISHSKSWIAPTTLAEAAWRTLTGFSAGTQAIGATPLAQWLGGGLLALLCIVGTLALCRRNLTAGIWLAALGMGAPLLLGEISLFRPAFTEQYVIAAAPGMLLIAMAGLAALTSFKAPPGLARWLRTGTVAGLALLALLSLSNYFFNPRYAKSPNWQAVMSYLKETARPGEVVAINLPDPAFFLYYHGSMPVETVPQAPLAELGQPAAQAQLERLRDSFDHIRFFFSPSPSYDPDGFAGKWLENCCEKTADIFVAGFRVQTFDTPKGSVAARQPYPVDFTDGVTLTGYRVVTSEVAAGETIHLTLFWTARTPPQSAYTVFVHLLAPDGFDLINADSPPDNGRRPTDGWAVGETIIDPHLISIPDDMTPGDYTLELGLYVPSTGQRLETTDSAGQKADQVHLPISLKVRSP